MAGTKELAIRRELFFQPLFARTWERGYFPPIHEVPNLIIAVASRLRVHDITFREADCNRPTRLGLPAFDQADIGECQARDHFIAQLEGGANLGCIGRELQTGETPHACFVAEAPSADLSKMRVIKLAL